MQTTVKLTKKQYTKIGGQLHFKYLDRPTRKFQHIYDNTVKRFYNDFFMLSHDRPTWDKKLHRWTNSRPFYMFNHNPKYLRKIAYQKPIYNYAISYNMCRKNRRTEKNLSVLFCVVIDLDVMKAFIKAGKTLQNLAQFDLVGLILYLYQHHLNPTAIIDSGHGFHLVFLLKPFIVKPVNEQITLNNYKAITESIGQLCDEFTKQKYHLNTYDNSTNTPTNLFRITGTYNNKSLREHIPVKVIAGNFHARYDFIKLVHRFTNYHKNIVRKRKFVKSMKQKYGKNYHRTLQFHNDFIKYCHYINKCRNHPLHIYKRKHSVNVSHQIGYRTSMKKFMKGYIRHIQDNKYQIYGHLELSLFIYCVIKRNMKHNYYYMMNSKAKAHYLTQIKQLKGSKFKSYQANINRANQSIKSGLQNFMQRVIKPKCIKQGCPLSDNDITTMLNRLNNEIDNKNDIYFYPQKVVISIMGFDCDKLWTTKRRHRTTNQKVRRSSKSKLKRKARRQYKRGWNKSKIVQKYHISWSTVNELLK